MSLTQVNQETQCGLVSPRPLLVVLLLLLLFKLKAHFPFIPLKHFVKSPHLGSAPLCPFHSGLCSPPDSPLPWAHRPCTLHTCPWSSSHQEASLYSEGLCLGAESGGLCSRQLGLSRPPLRASNTPQAEPFPSLASTAACQLTPSSFGNNSTPAPRPFQPTTSLGLPAWALTGGLG